MSNPLVQTTGRRKRAVARVRVKTGSGTITVNGRTLEDFFPSDTHRMIITEPLRITSTDGSFDIDATIDGDHRESLKKAGFLTRDSRKKESKKYGLKKARKAPQFSKR